MPTLTRENAKYHCRTCLVKLVVNSAEDPDPEAFVEETDMQEFKEIAINITTNSELQHLIAKHLEEELAYATAEELPDNLCLSCYKKLQGFEKFRNRARASAEKLQAVLGGSGVTKVEIDFDEVEQQETPAINNDDIYKLLLKDTLMETESVLLDNTAVATLASVQMLDPDPFGSTAPMKVGSNEDLSAEEDPCDWQRNVNSSQDNSSDSNNLFDSDDDKALARGMKKKKTATTAAKYDDDQDDEDDDNEDDDEEDEEDDDEEDGDGDGDGDEEEEGDDDNKRTTRLQSKSKKVTKSKKQTRKKRRTKKEMEEWRRAQAEKLENKIKRRNKGTKNSFKCAQCNHCFAHKITLDAHVRKVHEGSKRPFQCDRCDKSYTFIGGLYTHIKEIHETEVRSYTCDHPGCDRIYTSFIAMQKHKRMKHTDLLQQKKYVCEQCGATFNQSGNLKYHRRTKHPTEAEQAEKEKSKERFECEICKKLFHSRYTLKYHTLQLHSDDMKYECNICGRRMAKKFMLVQHMLVHSTEKMPCEHCGKQFIRKFELEAHIRAVHMKLKPFECQYCLECFASRKTLRHHVYIHTGEKPYVCDICGQAYRQQTCLKNHRKSHDKLSAEALLAANLNRTLMNSLLGPQQACGPVLPAAPTASGTSIH